MEILLTVLLGEAIQAIGPLRLPVHVVQVHQVHIHYDWMFRPVVAQNISVHSKRRHGGPLNHGDSGWVGVVHPQPHLLIQVMYGSLQMNPI
jgi:hypothetical protein